MITICTISGCGKKHLSLGYCADHYRRLKRYGDPLGKAWWWGLDPIERFWHQTDKRDILVCWDWMGAVRGIPPHSYGSVWTGEYRTTSSGKRVPKHIGAHRFSYELHFGEIPDGMIVCHTCDNTLCVNPAHLFLGTQTDNMNDMVSKGRSDNRGDRNGRSKLTREVVEEIRRLSTGRHGEGMEFARRYGVTSATVSKVLRGDTWSR